jgi:proteic killer suppression protein
VIKSFRHKGIEKFFRTGARGGIQPHHAAKLRRQLGQLDAANNANDMNIPGWKLHPLKGSLKGRWAVWLTGIGA